MNNVNVYEAIAGLLNGDGREKKGRYGSDARKPDEVMFVPGTKNTLQIGVYRSTSSRDGSRSLYFDPRRVKEGNKLLKTLPIEQLPALILGLFTLARGASRDAEWVDATTRARLAFIADQLEQVVAASEADLTNGAASEPAKTSLFDLAS